MERRNAMTDISKAERYAKLGKIVNLSPVWINTPEQLRGRDGPLQGLGDAVNFLTVMHSLANYEPGALSRLMNFDSEIADAIFSELRLGKLFLEDQIAIIEGIEMRLAKAGARMAENTNG
jgi:hypothetical protein